MTASVPAGRGPPVLMRYIDPEGRSEDKGCVWEVTTVYIPGKSVAGLHQTHIVYSGSRAYIVGRIHQHSSLQWAEYPAVRIHLLREHVQPICGLPAGTLGQRIRNSG